MSLVLVLALASQPVEAQACKTELVQDLNCNGIEASLEPAIDLSDPTCASNVDDADNPYPTADWYVLYDMFGCDYPTAGYDLDDAGLVVAEVASHPRYQLIDGGSIEPEISRCTNQNALALEVRDEIAETRRIDAERFRPLFWRCGFEAGVSGL